MIKCAYSLTDLIEPNSGQALVLPRSNLLAQSWTFLKRATRPGGLEPKLKPGDCLLIENRTWYAEGVNLSDRIRKAVMIGYGYRWATPIDYKRQTDELLEKVTPLERYLLGEPMVETDEYQTNGANHP